MSWLLLLQLIQGCKTMMSLEQDWLVYKIIYKIMQILTVIF